MRSIDKHIISHVIHSFAALRRTFTQTQFFKKTKDTKEVIFEERFLLNAEMLKVIYIYKILSSYNI
jgi:hypothetical protein